MKRTRERTSFEVYVWEVRNQQFLRGLHIFYYFIDLPINPRFCSPFFSSVQTSGEHFAGSPRWLSPVFSDQKMIGAESRWMLARVCIVASCLSWKNSGQNHTPSNLFRRIGLLFDLLISTCLDSKYNWARHPLSQWSKWIQCGCQGFWPTVQATAGRTYGLTSMNVHDIARWCAMIMIILTIMYSTTSTSTVITITITIVLILFLIFICILNIPAFQTIWFPQKFSTEKL